LFLSHILHVPLDIVDSDDCAIVAPSGAGDSEIIWAVLEGLTSVGAGTVGVVAIGPVGVVVFGFVAVGVVVIAVSAIGVVAIGFATAIDCV
jgi:hypothetical protein